MALIGRRRRVLIPGPVLIGFSTLFDRAHGDPHTPRPYLKVIPSRVGDTLLPFPCPHCGAVRSVVVDPKTRLGYRDRERSFSWCPACQKRYDICLEGTPLKSALPPGATHAPALVERKGTTEVIGLLAADGLTVLGASR